MTRILIGLAVVVSLGAAAFYALGGRNAYYALITEDTQSGSLDPAEAHRMAREGELLLIDIRQPEEWAATGSAGASTRLDMRRADFLTELATLAEGDLSRPIALICASGVRSAWLSNRLAEAGFRQIIDVPEGMMGSRAGPGWLARGLPVDRG